MESFHIPYISPDVISVVSVTCLCSEWVLLMKPRIWFVFNTMLHNCFSFIHVHRLLQQGLVHYHATWVLSILLPATRSLPRNVIIFGIMPCLKQISIYSLLSSWLIINLPVHGSNVAYWSSKEFLQARSDFRPLLYFMRQKNKPPFPNS